jgi:c-di-GMP-binding flagellar brake protein YcgR
MTRERREYPRVSQPLTVKYRIQGSLDTLWHEATTVNVSAIGMRMRGSELLEPDAAIEVALEVPGFKEVLRLRCRVIWAQLQASQVIESGVEFEPMKPEQETKLDQLLRFFH